MNDHPYTSLDIPERTGDLLIDMRSFLTRNGHNETAVHCERVGMEAMRIAERFGEDASAALHAGYLHDISGVFPNEARIEAARAFGIAILPEEERFPMIIHQKLSKRIAFDLFGVTDHAILDAVECHTTLKRNATGLDKVLFVADKIAWDQQGTPPYLAAVTAGLERSLDHAAYGYIRYLWEQRAKLRVVHPWLAEAYDELHRKLC